MIEFDQVAVNIEPCVFPCGLYISVTKEGTYNIANWQEKVNPAVGDHFGICY